MKLSQIIAVGKAIKEGYNAGNTTIETQKYVIERDAELQKLGYNNQTTRIEMIYFELGANELAGTAYKAGIGSACETIGGRGGAALGTMIAPESLGASTFWGYLGGALAGKTACDTGVDKAIKPIIIEPAVKKLSEDIFSKNKNLKNPNIDLSKLKLQINSSAKPSIQSTQHTLLETVRGILFPKSNTAELPPSHTMIYETAAPIS